MGKFLGGAGLASATSDPIGHLELRSRGAAFTRRLGEGVGARLHPGDCLALIGPLGAGKTTLVQGVVAGAGGGADVRSPTFLLHSMHRGRITVHHLDLYRLGEGTDLRSLGVDEMLDDGAVLVEWGDRAAPGWFTGTVNIALGSTDERILTLDLPDRLLEGVADG